MFSVIFLDPFVSDFLEPCRFIFQPYINKDMLCFCPWDRTKMRMTDGICPELFDHIRGHEEWQAVVLSVDSIFNYASSEIPDAAHPFDFSAGETHDLPHESGISWIRLAHLLCGYPEPAPTHVCGKKYKDPQTGKSVFVPLDAFTASFKNALLDDDPNLRIEDEVKVVPPDSAQLSEYERLRPLYEFLGDRPKRVVYIGTRSRSDERSYSMTSLEFRTKDRRSRDWQKNAYPAACRFLVYDFSRRGSAGFLRDKIEFCLSVLTFCINDFGSDILKLNRLYRLGVKLDTDAFVHALKGHLDQLAAGEHYLNQELRVLSEDVASSEMGFIKEQPIILGTYDKMADTDETCAFAEDAAADMPMQRASAPEDEVGARDALQRDIDLAAVRLRKCVTGYGEQNDGVLLDAYQYAYLEQKIRVYERIVLGMCPAIWLARAEDKKVKEEHGAYLEAQKEKSTGSPLEGISRIVFYLLLCIMGLFAWYLYYYEIAYAWMLACAGILVVILISVIYSLHSRKRDIMRCHMNEDGAKTDEKMDCARENWSFLKQNKKIKNAYEDYFTAINTLMFMINMRNKAYLIDKMRETRTSFIKKQLQYMAGIKEAACALYAQYSYHQYRHEKVDTSVSYNYGIVPETHNPFYYLKPETEEDGLNLNDDGSFGKAPYDFVVMIGIHEDEHCC